MTVNEAIARIDRLRDNSIPTDVKIGWLENVDRYVQNEIVAGRADAPEAPTFPYGREEDTPLLVPPPYDEVYLFKLEAMIYYEQREIKKYASSMALYNQAMAEYARKYVREHAALPHPPVIYS